MPLVRPPRSSPRGRLSDAIAEHLTQRIATRVLRPGDELPSEAELALQFKVSKPVVREALGSLAALGIVEIRQGRPTTVQPLSSAPLDHFFGVAIRSSENGLREALELRRALETETAALAAMRASASYIDHLGELVEKMRAHLYELDAWLEADFAFHMALVRSTENSLLQFLTEALSDVMRQSIRLLGSQMDLRDPAATLKRHEAIFDAVRKHDPVAARAAMQTHFDATQSTVLAISQDKSRLDR
jgi:GntR family transcriptional repressor for pyruvate dehydrogenase complex